MPQLSCFKLLENSHNLFAHLVKPGLAPQW